jgi:DNA-binding NtrC family response regulator
MISQSPRTPLKLDEMLRAYERIVIIKTIQTCDGSRTRAATALGLTRRSLYGRIQRLGINLQQLPVKMGRPLTRGSSR